jgi:hypothetical protein
VDNSLINPRLIQRFHDDLTVAELAVMMEALDRVPGDELGRRMLWEKFERNIAVALIQRNAAHDMVCFAFYEVREDSHGRDFFISGACSILPTRTATEESLPQYENFARILGCNRLRFQTPRPGLVRKAIKAGWLLGTSDWLTREFVVFKKVGDTAGAPRPGQVT